MRMTKIDAGPAHKAFKADVDALLVKHGETLSAPELLAMVSQICGMVIALQDQNSMTTTYAMAIVHSNIELGNAIVSSNLQATQGRA